MLIHRRKAFRSSYDADAVAYFDAITTAGSTITTANKDAVNALVVGLKADGIWTAIKACCLLAGPDDLTGALVPLVGGAPTNNNFVSGDYSRTTGLLGNGTNKQIVTNRANNADTKDNYHASVYMTVAGTTGTRALLGDNTAYNQLLVTATENTTRCQSGTASSTVVSYLITGFRGASRSASATYTARANGANSTRTTTSSATNASVPFVFSRGSSYFDGRLSFYSIGEALDLALLDARIATYVAALT